MSWLLGNALQVFASANTAEGQQHKLSSELANMTQQLEAVECMQQVKLQQLSGELAGVQQQLAHEQQQSLKLHLSWQQVSRGWVAYIGNCAVTTTTSAGHANV